MNGTIHTMYFSPTHTTQKVATAVAEGLGMILNKSVEEINLTSPNSRNAEYHWGESDVLVLGFPVYGGRIPAFLENCMKNLRGDHTPAIVIGVYGNRDFDDALLEAEDLLTANGFEVAAAGAFIGEHSMTAKVAAGRPDESDMEQAERFVQLISEKMLSGFKKAAEVSGQRPYKERGPSAPAAPKTKDSCTKCMVCVKGCPMGIISTEDPSIVSEGCIRCCACVKACPTGAKYFDDERSFKIANMLETNCMERKDPVFFL